MQQKLESTLRQKNVINTMKDGIKNLQRCLELLNVKHAEGDKQKVRGAGSHKWTAEARREKAKIRRRIQGQIVRFYPGQSREVQQKSEPSV